MLLLFGSNVSIVNNLFRQLQNKLESQPKSVILPSHMGQDQDPDALFWSHFATCSSLVLTHAVVICYAVQCGCFPIATHPPDQQSDVD